MDRDTKKIFIYLLLVIFTIAVLMLLESSQINSLEVRISELDVLLYDLRLEVNNLQWKQGLSDDSVEFKLSYNASYEKWEVRE